MRGTVLLLAATVAASPGRAAPPAPSVPVILAAGDLDPCALGRVAGLRAGGDGYLSARAAPAASAAELARLTGSRAVYVCAERGDWLGIIWGRAGQECGVSSPPARAAPYTGPCRSGWAHRRYVEIVAG